MDVKLILKMAFQEEDLQVCVGWVVEGTHRAEQIAVLGDVG